MTAGAADGRNTSAAGCVCWQQWASPARSAALHSHPTLPSLQTNSLQSLHPPPHQHLKQPFPSPPHYISFPLLHPHQLIAQSSPRLVTQTFSGLLLIHSPWLPQTHTPHSLPSHSPSPSPSSYNPSSFPLTPQASVALRINLHNTVPSTLQSGIKPPGN